MTDRHTLESGLDALNRRVHDAHTSVQAGAPPDLSGMEAEANRLLAGIAALPEGEGRELAPQVEGVIDALDALAAALGEQDDTPRPAAPAGRVAAAYAGPPGRTG